MEMTYALTRNKRSSKWQFPEIEDWNVNPA